MNISQVKDFITKNSLLRENSTVLIGVSGGPDSLALLHFLWTNYPNNKLLAVHVDHMFRGKESEQDLMSVKEFCRKRDISFESTQINVKKYQEDMRVSSQVAARDCRYEFFKEMMEKYEGDYLALGHHGDDQIETILMRMVRGGSSYSRAGMRAKRVFATGYLIRPFLCLNKSDIESYCTNHDLVPRYDPSNEEDKYTRNRFRNHVLPFFKKENQQVHLRFQQYSEQLIEDEALLEELTQDKLNTVIRKQDKDEVSISVSNYSKMPKPLQRRGIQLILKYLYKDTSPDLNSIHIDNLLSFLANEHPSGILHFPLGLRIIRSYDDCHFSFLEKKTEPYSFIIEQDSVIECNNGYELVSETRGYYPEEFKGEHIFVIDPDSVVPPLYVRSRKTGDKMTQKGMKGTKKVKDIFIDKKVDRGQRELWPIVTDSQGTILWIPLLKKSSYEASNLLKDKYILLQYKATKSRGQS
ncbi:tRNA lysidine(34) synthetase TilS [Litchfieldia salsa]|uniref:tRNA(Ile)-lysidine synthase n=1 Tax=Litchfieldia salsa TaxID=930152 RepID=A0A1H0WZ36_9BACI|nr:tRNA lysidine(34) synthetase TilS [Litchfieldia salsa]SDP95961.1 tRNA(Ile)-lysidine synthase [Litchfieldia salsa]